MPLHSPHYAARPGTHYPPMRNVASRYERLDSDDPGKSLYEELLKSGMDNLILDGRATLLRKGVRELIKTL